MFAVKHISDNYRSKTQHRKWKDLRDLCAIHVSGATSARNAARHHSTTPQVGRAKDLNYFGKVYHPKQHGPTPHHRGSGGDQIKERGPQGVGGRAVLQIENVP